MNVKHIGITGFANHLRNPSFYQVSNNGPSARKSVEFFIGAAMVCLGVYLFWEPSYGRKPTPSQGSTSSASKFSGEIGQAVWMSVRPGFIPRRGLRIYRAFAFVGAIFGFVASKLLISIPSISSEISPNSILLICIVIGSFLGYILPRVAENYIVVLGPPVAVVLTYEYLLYERGVDFQELVGKIPLIPEISHTLLSSIILVSTTFLTLVFRMYLRQILPIFMSGLLSGGLIGNGMHIIESKSIPLSSAEIELQNSMMVALCSITFQMYVKFYGRERGIKRKKAKDRERSLIKRTGDTVVLNCPECSESAPHKVVNRKETASGVELLVNCRGLNQFDEVCNFHHSVIEIGR